MGSDAESHIYIGCGVHQFDWLYLMQLLIYRVDFAVAVIMHLSNRNMTTRIRLNVVNILNICSVFAYIIVCRDMHKCIFNFLQVNYKQNWMSFQR